MLHIVKGLLYSRKIYRYYIELFEKGLAEVVEDESKSVPELQQLKIRIIGLFNQLSDTYVNTY